MSFEILDPVQDPVDTVFPVSPRLSTLNGKVIGLYNNNKLNSVRLMEMIAEELSKEYMFKTKHGFYHAFRRMEDHEWGDVTECDAVILANGDCGACSSSGIANAIDLEKLGVPCLLISTPPFFDAVKTMSDVCGMSEIRWAVVEHPIGSVAEEPLRARAILAAKQFKDIILTDAGKVELGRDLATAGGR
jgi:hypothetical protein